jgi:antitoxin (DNA-binding transcriptional repressor) of toxin-antitoxin stability system
LKASVVDMRYKMTEVLDALERNESVEILYHGKTKGVIQPLARKTGKSVKEHRFFGMRDMAEEPVHVIMEKLRGQRYK